MPKFTIETTYHLPVYRHRSYEADTLDQPRSPGLGSMK
jgi:hypothetical protein